MLIAYYRVFLVLLMMHRVLKENALGIELLMNKLLSEWRFRESSIQANDFVKLTFNVKDYSDLLFTYRKFQRHYD